MTLPTRLLVLAALAVLLPARGQAPEAEAGRKQ